MEPIVHRESEKRRARLLEPKEEIHREPEVRARKSVGESGRGRGTCGSTGNKKGKLNLDSEPRMGDQYKRADA